MHLLLSGPTGLSAAEGGAPVRQSAGPAADGGVQGHSARPAEGHRQHQRGGDLDHAAKHKVRRGQRDGEGQVSPSLGGDARRVRTLWMLRFQWN